MTFSTKGTAGREINKRYHYWLRQVTEELKKIRKSLKKKDVHDLRKAIRRCRTMTQTFREIEPHACFSRLDKLSKKLFKPLGKLRDVQVMKDWTQKLLGREAPKALKIFDQQERKSKKKAKRAIRKFDTAKWAKLTGKAEKRNPASPFLTCAFQPMALQHLEETFKAHQVAKRKKSNASYHRLRIAFKKYRYYLENFLPALYEAWKTDLEKIQDLLGDYHDLAVLDENFKKAGKRTKIVKEKISNERRARAEAYWNLFQERNLWAVWRERLGSSIVA